MIFPGNTGTVSCTLPQLSRTVPPPLPGEYDVGEKVFYTGASLTFPSGNAVTYGQAGEVTGPTTLDAFASEGLKVMFPGNKSSITCLLTSLSRTPTSTYGS